jgi:hypothetical protein
MRTTAIAVALSLVGATAAQDQGQDPTGWPRAITLEQGTLVVYTPQIEKLDGVTLSGRAAVSWEAKGKATGEAKGAAPVFGVFWFDARVLLDKERRVVHVEAIDVTKVRFRNTTPEQEKRVALVIEAQVPIWDLTPSLDELQAAIATSERVKKSEQGIQAPTPQLLFTTEPAVLLLYDGAPAVRPIRDTDLERVVNTPLFVVRDPSTKRFYLGSDTYWYESADPKGPWKLVPAPTPKVKAFFDANPPPPPPRAEEPGPQMTEVPPASAQQPAQPGQPGATASQAAPVQQPAATPTQGAPVAQPPTPTEGAPVVQAPTPTQGAPKPDAAQKPDAPPKIIVATKPTELIAFDGKPSYVPLGSDGKLLYADNTDSTVLVYVSTNETFVLVSGRWYKATSLEGPWTAVRPDRVPADFKSIPSDSAVGEVRTFVAGTEEAEDALADSQIPQTTAVKREQTLEVTYDGEPTFKAIEGTSMAYAVNTQFSVIQDAGLYWCCHQGVWYVASTAKGPWKVSDKRPPSADQIPPSSPVYNVKYVYVYDTTPSTVYVGYLPGYAGVYPYYGSVVYGTGWYYPPYIGTMGCYPYPATFGLNLSFNPYTGFGVGVSWGTPFFSVGIHFGGYGRFYGPAGYRAPYRPVYGYRPRPAGYRGAYNAGYRGGYGGGYGAGYRAGTRASYGGNIYNRPANTQRNATPAGSAARAPTRSGQPNNVYAGKDGSVYRQNQGGSWDRNTASGWQSAGGAQQSSAGGAPQRSSVSSPSSASSAPAGLGADSAARSRSYSGGGYAGGGRGFSGGGGRGGGRR